MGIYSTKPGKIKLPDGTEIGQDTQVKAWPDKIVFERPTTTEDGEAVIGCDIRIKFLGLDLLSNIPRATQAGCNVALVLAELAKLVEFEYLDRITPKPIEDTPAPESGESSSDPLLETPS